VASRGIDPAIGLRETLREALARHGERAVLLCSFQKEESVLIDELLSVSGRPDSVRIVTIDTGVLFEETLKTWKTFEERFGVKIEVQDASGPGGPWTGPENCCSVAKVAALERTLDGAECWITGIRREQGPTRAATELIERDEKRGLWKYNPWRSGRRRPVAQDLRARPAIQPASRPGLRVDRLRDLHAARQRARGALGG